MKYVILACFAALSAISVGRWLVTERHAGDAPVLYWVTDNNPARTEQIRLFREWLAKNGHPDVDLRVDAANTDVSKKVIQGVSGAAGDIIDMAPTEMPFLVSIGMLEDVTDAGKRLGFSPEHTWPAIRSQIEMDGRQYRFPCNVFVHLLWVNKDTFAKLGQPLPPRVWDFETFERLGKAFVAAANPPGKRQTVFYVDSLDTGVMRRSVGLDTFNETLTRCTLDDARYVEVLDRLHRWTYVDRILPTAADIESFSTGAGYGGATPQLFNNGNYGMFRMGRYALIQLREFGNLNLAVTEPPHGGFRNSLSGTRASGIYKGSKHKKEAELFLSFLASESYNMQVVVDADAEPPDPKYAHGDAFDRPPAFPNEWEAHAPFARGLDEIGLPATTSPFVLPSVVERLDLDAYDAFMRSGRTDAAGAARQAAERINAEIERSLKENPSLVADFESRQARQREIDARRAAGQKVPLAWIENPFHRAYYAAKGWAE